jgi:type I restriction enzyme S subunit
MCSRATVGPRCINKVPMSTNQGFKSFVVDKNLADIEFVYYLLETCIADFKKLANGSTFIELSKTDVERYKIYLPSLPEQQVIAKVLSAADKEIELLQKSIEQEKQKKKALSQLLLTGIVRVKIYEC